MQLLNTNSSSYVKVEKIGEGSFGEVYIAKNMKNDKLFVCKEMKLNGLDEPTVMQLFTEVKVLQAIQHPNIVEMTESYRTKSNKLVLILEYLSGGDLAEFIKNRNGQYIPQQQIEIWILQLCLALKHSHDHKIVHRDLKTSNIFMDDMNNLKLGDFGLAKNLIGSKQNLKGFTGTPLYLAPESISQGLCSFKSDIWSLGLIIYELCSLNNPFYCTSYPELIQRICHKEVPPIPSVYSMELNHFIMSLLRKKQVDRPSIREILESDFIRTLLFKNKQEFNKLVSQNTLSNIEFNDVSMKNDFNTMKVYRFSEYKDPSNMVAKIEKMVKKTDTFSKFKKGEMVLSDDEEEDEGVIEESGVFNDSPMIKGINNVNINIKNKSSDSCQSFGLLSKAGSSDNENKNNYGNDRGLLSDDELPATVTNKNLKLQFDDSFSERNESKAGKEYNKMLQSFFDSRKEKSDKNTVEQEHQEYKPTVSTQAYNSKIHKKESLLAEQKPSQFQNNQALLSSDEEEVEKPEKELPGINEVRKHKRRMMESMYEGTKKKGVSKTPNYLIKSGSKTKPANKLTNTRNSYFLQYQELTSQASNPQKKKFRITKRSPIEPHKQKDKYTSVENRTLSEFNGRMTATLSGKKTNKLKFKKNLIKNLDKNNFKVKMKKHNKNMDNKMEVIRINLKHIDCVGNKSREHKTVTVRSSKKLPSIRVSCGGRGSVRSKKLTSSTRQTTNYKKTCKTETADEYGFLTITNNTPIKPRKKSRKTHKNSVDSSKELYQRYCNSKITQIKLKKDSYAERMKERFKDVYEDIRRLLMIHGVKKIESKLTEEKWIMSQMKKLVGKDSLAVKNKRCLMDLVKLSVMEVRVNML